MHGPGLDMVRATKLSEMPILPLRSLQLSDREEGHPHRHYNFELMSPLGEKKINTLQIQTREKSQMSGWRYGNIGNSHEAWEKEILNR